jgi:hypothetical protein
MKHHIALELTDEMVDQLRFVIDSLPICTYHRLILAVLPKLPLESAAANPSAGATVALTPLGAAVGFSLHALTPKGRERLPELERLLSRIPHGGDL